MVGFVSLERSKVEEVQGGRAGRRGMLNFVLLWWYSEKLEVFEVEGKSHKGFRDTCFLRRLVVCYVLSSCSSNSCL